MKDKNDIFIVKRWEGELGPILTLELGPSLGTYQIEFSLEEEVFEYSSPISGKLLYILNLQQQQKRKSTNTEWVGLEDGHAFEGIFVRDLIRQCQGLPDL
ncbi:MAG: hypothetical protein SGARI_006043 [Bacillariaceae sp.]